MALELKGLKANMMRLHKRIDTLNQLASAGDTKGGELEKALTDIGTQLASHMDDLNFAATMLGNSGGGSNGAGEGQESPKEPADSDSGEMPKSPVAPPQDLSDTFRARAEAQIAAAGKV